MYHNNCKIKSKLHNSFNFRNNLQDNFYCNITYYQYGTHYLLLALIISMVLITYYQ